MSGPVRWFPLPGNAGSNAIRDLPDQRKTQSHRLKCGAAARIDAQQAVERDAERYGLMLCASATASPDTSCSRLAGFPQESGSSHSIYPNR
jgi:hypothetical protein